MVTEYKIKWHIPEGYDPTSVLRDLPSPIGPQMTEIYNYSVKPDGFYLLDNLVDQEVSGLAMKLFIDEALASADEVIISRMDK